MSARLRAQRTNCIAHWMPGLTVSLDVVLTVTVPAWFVATGDNGWKKKLANNPENRRFRQRSVCCKPHQELLDFWPSATVPGVYLHHIFPPGPHQQFFDAIDCDTPLLIKLYMPKTDISVFIKREVELVCGNCRHHEHKSPEWRGSGG